MALSRGLAICVTIAGCASCDAPIDDRFAPGDSLGRSAFDLSIHDHEEIRTLSEPFPDYCRFSVRRDGGTPIVFDRFIDRDSGTIRYDSGDIGEIRYYFDLDEAGRVLLERRTRDGDREREVLLRTVERDDSGEATSVVETDVFYTTRIALRDGAVTEWVQSGARGPIERWSYHHAAGRLADVQYFVRPEDPTGDELPLVQLDEYVHDGSRLIEIAQTTRYSTGTWSFTHADGDRRIIADHRRPDGLEETVELEVDDRDRLLSYERTQERDPPTWTRVSRRFDADGRILEYDVEGDAIGRTTFTYDYACEQEEPPER